MARTCAVVGVGLMGGSLALSLRARGWKVLGIDTSAAAIDRAVQKGAIDEGHTELSRVSVADFVILATPLHTTVATGQAAMPHLKSGALLTDIASVKAPITRDLEPHVRADVRYLGSHPMFGSDGQGIDAAQATLVQNAPFILTPTPNTHPTAVDDLSTWMRELGMSPIVLTPEEHDLRVAAVSHLSYLVAVAMMRVAPGLECAGPSFRDVTRVAQNPTGMWEEILAMNAGPIQTVLQALKAELERLSHLRGKPLHETLDLVRQTRLSLNPKPNST